MITLKNSFLEVSIAELGAELVSFCAEGEGYVWCGDKAYWGRHAPILFPIVGKVWQDSYRVEGATYHLNQHGFARDSVFQIVDLTETEATLELRYTEERLKDYPYPFVLTAHYRLNGRSLEIEWIVGNLGQSPMYYQIGAHPAFLYKDYEKSEKCHGYLQLLREGQTLQRVRVAHLDTLDQEGEGEQEMTLVEGMISLTDELFLDDALILENSQADEAVLLDKQHCPYLRVSFAGSPVLGLWSPKGKQAPFVCIEPWRGRADAEGYEGDISQRKWIQRLEGRDQSVFRYTISEL